MVRVEPSRSPAARSTMAPPSRPAWGWSNPAKPGLV